MSQDIMINITQDRFLTVLTFGQNRLYYFKWGILKSYYIFFDKNFPCYKKRTK